MLFPFHFYFFRLFKKKKKKDGPKKIKTIHSGIVHKKTHRKKIDIIYMLITVKGTRTTFIINKVHKY